MLQLHSTVWFDITDLIEYARHCPTVSGIQRVQIRLLSSIFDRHPNIPFQLVAFDRFIGRFVCIPSDWCRLGYEYDAQDLIRRSGVYVSRSRKQINTTYRNPITRTFYNTTRQFGARLHKARAHLAAFRPGERLVILGATWSLSGHGAALKQLRKSGIHIVSFIHDLIPVKTPEYVEEQLTRDFRRWILNLYDVASRMIANSEYTAHDLRTDMVLHAKRSIDVRVVALAHEFLTAPANGVEAAVSNAIKYIGRKPFVLFVGTIESRKNVLSLARVWQRLVREIGSRAPNLVLVGKLGYQRDDFESFMRASGNVSGHAYVVKAPSDADLAHLYRNCLFFAYPSFYEGWGLPVGEALWSGKTAVISQTSSLPEVGGDMCLYVDPDDLSSLYDMIKMLVTDPALRQKLESRIERSKLRTWNQVSDEILAAVLAPLTCEKADLRL